jgi:endonuclease/exonuclease/phosphatase family metal-dependent hydrolase
MKLKILLVFFLGFLYSSLFAQESVRLKVMTYNLRFGELASLKDIADFIATYSPDFVALQELDCMTKRKRTPHQHGKNFATELGCYTKMFPLYGKTISYAGGFYGIGMLTRFPYINVQKVMLPKQKVEHETRALLMAEIELPSGDTIIVASTHLDYTSMISRDKQLEIITKTLKEKRFPVILGGDFNTTPNSTEIRTYFEDWQSLSIDSLLTSPSKEPKNKIDYLFGYPQKCWRLISSRVENSSLSDHLPIFSEIELTF